MKGAGDPGGAVTRRGKKNKTAIQADGDGAAATTKTTSKRGRKPSQKVKEATVAAAESRPRPAPLVLLKATATAAAKGDATVVATSTLPTAGVAVAAASVAASSIPSVATAAATVATVQCSWSFYKPCNSWLPPPVKCGDSSGCNECVHHLCQVIWENKNNYSPPPTAPSRIVCPLHHDHYDGGGKQGSGEHSISLAAVAAANAAAAMVATMQAPPDLSSPGVLAGARVMSRIGSKVNHGRCDSLPPVMEVNNTTLQPSPAESTLTGQGITTYPQAGGHPFPVLPPMDSFFHFGSPDDIILDSMIDGEFQNNNAGDTASSGVVAPTVLEVEDEDDADERERDGGDSDDEGSVMDFHVIAMARRLVGDDDCEEVTNIADAERIVLHHNVTPTDDEEIDDEIGEPTSLATNEAAVSTSLVGAPDGWLPPCPPPTFLGYVRKHNAPEKVDIDNPAGWSDYTFTPSFDNRNNYKFHSTPAGARVVPADATGKRCIEGWEFHYQDWQGDSTVGETYARVGAGFGTIKPASRKGCLDVNVLKKHGMTIERLRDPAFFLQLLLPFCNPNESGLADDHRMPYFSHAAVCTNVYACMKAAGMGYGHAYSIVDVTELVHWTGVPIRNGALGGKPATLQHRWKDATDGRHDHFIADSINQQRWRQIKRYFKVNLVTNEIKRGLAGYDPCVKYDYIWKCLCHNMNYVTAEADLDCTYDETTWGFTGYSGEAGGRLKNKPVSKGESHRFIFVIEQIIEF